jgi:hypothetical protein
MELGTASPNQSLGDPDLDIRSMTVRTPMVTSSTEVIPNQSGDMVWRGGEHNFEGNPLNIFV